MRKIEWFPWGLVIGFGIGLAYGGWYVMRYAKEPEVAFLAGMVWTVVSVGVYLAQWWRRLPRVQR